jgi:hypothetical protein
MPWDNPTDPDRDPPPPRPGENGPDAPDAPDIPPRPEPDPEAQRAPGAEEDGGGPSGPPMQAFG